MHYNGDYRNWEWLQKELHGRQTKKLDNNTYARLEDGKVIIKLHATDIIVADEDGMTLDSGGWQTPTTRDRFNNYLPAGVHIWQENGVWYIVKGYNRPNWEDDKLKFVDGIHVAWDGTITGGVKPDDKKAKRLLRRINAYANGYAEAFYNGDVPKPGLGDCFYCSFREEGTGKPMGELGEHPTHEHLFSHIEEKYYVPSLLINVLESAPGRFSQVARWGIQAMWNGKGKEELGYIAEIAQEQMARAIAAYLKARLPQVEEPELEEA